ncbi:26S proteasome non-ATPase regulatory subunit 13-like, partial [Actinia tenebrosa]|uniref:26S proteasome non-ATPase regulatory subunit 13 n=1 Tax=Actinia tenebrosa TaxID=6105 RepID=A0A6P8HMC1_ACTTE
MRDVKVFLGNKQSEGGPLASEWAALEELYDKRLWHQLTLALVEFVKNDYFVKNKGLLDMHENFLADFEHRINPLTLMEISLYIVKEYSDPDKAVEFLEKQREKVKNVLEADILCLTSIGNIRLEEKKMNETKTVIAQAREMLDTIDGVTTVHDRFYKLCSNFHKISGNYNEYYRDALRYLGCVDLSQLSDTEKVERALHLSLAALLGSNVYNFGELLAHQVLKAIQGTEHNWIVELLYAFNSGNLSKFESLRPQWEKQPDMVKNQLALQQKIRLL